MEPDTHFRRLEQLYHTAPITRWYGAVIHIADGTAEVRLRIRPEFLHAANAIHGSVYFRLLDDAAFFAVNSRVQGVFVLTVSFTIHFTGPANEGELIATGRVVHEAGRLFVGESELRDTAGRLLATGSGTFSRSKIVLDERVGYRDANPP
jgi:uncharacterized protein (TIGR00369 family)